MVRRKKTWTCRAERLGQREQGRLYSSQFFGHIWFWFWNKTKIYFTKGNCFGSQCCGCGSGRIAIILPDPELNPHPGSVDLDQYTFQPSVKLNVRYFFPDNYSTVQNIENHDTYDADGKVKTK
jgi:hypothetical protein